MNSIVLNDACPLEDFSSVLYMIRDEFMQFTRAAVTLVFVLFSAVKVTAMLAECVLSVAVKATAEAAYPRPHKCVVVEFFKRLSIHSTIIAPAALLLWWLYVVTVVGPVYLVVTGVALSAVRFCGAVVATVFG